MASSKKKKPDAAARPRKAARKRRAAAIHAEVARFEPLGALDGGADGLDAYRLLASQAGEFLTANGLIAFEVGAGQAPDVAVLLEEAGFASCAIRRDLAGIERCVLARRG